ncbi:MAG: cytochrome c biogenesis protein CcdA [Methanoregula sp.]|jgi:cytochrome c biogenesis protein CcdA/thiol-disulfide isomerase/thioredoxin
MDRKKNKKPEKKQDTRPDSIPEKTPGKIIDNLPDKKILIAAALIATAVLLCAVFFGLPLLNASQSSPLPETGSGTVTVYYFYGTECPHCHEVTPYVESLREKYPYVNFRLLEIWHDDTNNALYNLLNHNLGQKSLGVPEAIVGNVSLFGEDEIKAGLEPAILNQTGNLKGSKELAAFPVSGSSNGTNATITAIYFYGNGCSHCEKVKPLVTDIETRYPELSLLRLEINDNQTNREKFLSMRLQYGIGTAGSLPTIFIGENALVGEPEVTDHFEEKVLFEKQRLASGTPTTPAPLVSSGLPAGGNVSVDAFFFYSDSCSHCEKVKPIIANISARYPDLNLTQLEINHYADNRELFNALSSRYSIPNPGVPTIFIGNNVLIGEAEIANRFETGILTERERIASGTPALPVNQTLANPGSQPAAPALSPFMVIFAALVDSMNPCGLSVLVFLLISMAAAAERKRILLVGGVYTAAMFLFHLFVGIGLFSALSLSGLSKPFSIIGGVIALILGIATLTDVLRNKETYLLSIPESGKGLLGTYIRKATLPAAFVLGILAGILGFSCTGGIYISILGLMGRDMTVMAGLPWLILYNLVFVLPLVLVTLLAAYGVSPDRAERWRTKNKRTVRVIIGIILVVLGLVILSGWMG